ncbi:hypothetical protein [uncultured Campylobacter sp.]|uniref:hypothetical protein n=1 Tax=uncultured Campylobacter sp. TaxID=218934 RepID=UPI00260CB841|nr:hypothetical protein [uncultured Campylobacter sp.]
MSLNLRGFDIKRVRESVGLIESFLIEKKAFCDDEFNVISEESFWEIARQSELLPDFEEIYINEVFKRFASYLDSIGINLDNDYLFSKKYDEDFKPLKVFWLINDKEEREISKEEFKDVKELDEYLKTIL